MLCVVASFKIRNHYICICILYICIYIYIWCIARFSISHFFAVCIIARTHTRARMLAPFLPSCHFYSFVWVNMAFLRIYHMLNVRMPFKRVNIKQFNNLAMFECFFLISKYHEDWNAMSSFTVIHRVPWKT